MGKGQNARLKKSNFNERKNNVIKKGSTSSYTSLTLSKILSPLTTSKKGTNGNVITSVQDPFNKSKNLKVKKLPILTKKSDLSKNKIKQSARKLKDELDNTNIEEISMLVQPKSNKRNHALELEKMEEQRKLQQEKFLEKEQLNNDFELALEKLGAI
ncbi:hypothetical protein BCR32DRAFT_327188 [Anaeromyces robustus]|uniref:Uncharacterized protein n=1 Tax=Anaeromyces robustus TaxID=1754192 RepID=A0A1Y1X8Q9_9FUNG|nr:hypothetical protein BCR32DRAFT_327188 [Anaeromyces robustus]|eukprot:ORX81734.1 hypothetical protein BCR32DRAFT_327188 [Anaeromyces robustus]